MPIKRPVITLLLASLTLAQFGPRITDGSASAIPITTSTPENQSAIMFPTAADPTPISSSVLLTSSCAAANLTATCQARSASHTRLALLDPGSILAPKDVSAPDKESIYTTGPADHAENMKNGTRSTKECTAEMVTTTREKDASKSALITKTNSMMVASASLVAIFMTENAHPAQ